VRTHSANITRIGSLFSAAPLSTRWFIRLRWKLTPYREIAARLPTGGRVLDLGSGHGLLSLALSMGSDKREIIGIDHDQARVRLAERAAARPESLSKPRRLGCWSREGSWPSERSTSKVEWPQSGIGSTKTWLPESASHNQRGPTWSSGALPVGPVCSRQRVLMCARSHVGHQSFPMFSS